LKPQGYIFRLANPRLSHIWQIRRTGICARWLCRRAFCVPEIDVSSSEYRGPTLPASPFNTHPANGPHDRGQALSKGYAMAFEGTDTLSDKQKAYLVMRLAADDPPAEIAQGFRRMFGIDITPRAVAHYLPGMTCGETLSPALQALYWETRLGFVLTKVRAMDMQTRVDLQERVLFEAMVAGQYQVSDTILDAMAEEREAFEEEFGQHAPCGRYPLEFH
jgi:hypothetical protein